MGEKLSDGPNEHGLPSNDMADRLAQGRQVPAHFHQPTPFKEKPPTVIPRSSEATEAVNLGTGIHFGEITALQEHLRKQEKPS